MESDIQRKTRYHRHHILPEIGPEGQRRLASKRVAVIGVGGLGSPVCLYLAASGVGHLVLIDPDRVEMSNLQRQIIHSCDTLGRQKAESGATQVRNLNPDVQISICNTRLHEDNAEELLNGCDLVVGCVDSIDARYVINERCVALGIANVYGSADGFDGQVSVFSGEGRPCYRCFFREPPATRTAQGLGVFSPLPGVVGTLQAAEALKLLLSIGAPLTGRLLLADMLGGRFRELTISPDPDCPVCGRSAQASRH